MHIHHEIIYNMANILNLEEEFNNSFISNHQRCTIKKLFFKILQYSQENSCARPSGLQLQRLQHRYFPANIAITKFLKTSILKNNCERLLMHLQVFCEDLVNISCENALSLILRDFIQHCIFFRLQDFAFWFVKYLFRIDAGQPQNIN